MWTASSGYHISSDESSESNRKEFLKRKLRGGGGSVTGPAALGLMFCRVSASVRPIHHDNIASDLTLLAGCFLPMLPSKGLQSLPQRYGEMNASFQVNVFQHSNEQ